MAETIDRVKLGVALHRLGWDTTTYWIGKRAPAQGYERWIRGRLHTITIFPDAVELERIGKDGHPTSIEATDPDVQEALSAIAAARQARAQGEGETANG